MNLSGAHMGSPFRSALAKLDDSVQNLEYQLGCLRGGLDVTDDQLWQALDDANQSAVALRGMILSERPDADWNDRNSLETLIQHLEWEAQAQRDEQRRKKIFELAGELDAGSIKHRFESRVSALNSLRLQAVRELRIAGTLYEQEKELPGPGASEWVHWACNLREENDASIFADLRRDFPTLERFAGEMEESYWVPGQRENEAATLASLRSREGQGIPQPPRPAVVAVPSEASSRSARVLSEQPTRASDAALKSNYQAPQDTPSPERSTFLTEPPAAVAAATIHVPDQAAARSNSNGAAGELHASSTVNMWTVPAHPPAAAPPEEQPSGDAPDSVAADASTDDLLRSFDSVAAAKRPATTWIAAGVVVLLGAIFAATYYFGSASGGRSNGAVAHAASTPSASSDSVPAGANPGPGGQPSPASGTLGVGSTGSAIQAIEGAQHQILLNMESCRRSDLENIECQGYVTNLGSEPSHITLGGVDVVDGKGNSFNLNNIGQFNFSTGRSLSIAAGSRAKYTVKVPDKDRDARTLTVYVDVNNPHGLEFTFRNVPIAE
jgi:hypothetical protein